MKIFITFVSLFLLVITAKSQTTISGVEVNGQQYDITYRTNVAFDDYETAISTSGGNSRDISGNAIAAPWWSSDSGQANAFATAVYNANNANNDIRFAFKTQNLFGTAAVHTATYDGGNSVTSGVYAQDGIAVGQAGQYAISAVAVPAPLPILGILPVVGFLKRMRRRQSA